MAATSLSTSLTALDANGTSALKNEPITLEGNGKKKFFDFVHVDDTVNGVRKAIGHIRKKPKNFCDDFTLSANHPVSLHELAHRIVKLTGSRSKIVTVPERSYDVPGFWGSYAKAKKHLGWEPKIDLDAGLARGIEEIRRHIYFS